jgi:hypothetical protein
VPSEILDFLVLRLACRSFEWPAFVTTGHRLCDPPCIPCKHHLLVGSPGHWASVRAGWVQVCGVQGLGRCRWWGRRAPGPRPRDWAPGALARNGGLWWCQCQLKPAAALISHSCSVGLSSIPWGARWTLPRPQVPSNANAIKRAHPTRMQAAGRPLGP